MEDNLEARKLNVLIQAVTMDRKNGQEVNDLNTSWKKLYDVLTGGADTNKVSKQEAQNIEKMFNAFKNSKTTPKTFKMKIGKADKSAEFEGASIGELVEKTKK